QDRWNAGLLIGCLPIWVQALHIGRRSIWVQQVDIGVPVGAKVLDANAVYVHGSDGYSPRFLQIKSSNRQMSNLTPLGRPARGFGFSPRFRRRSPFFAAAVFPFMLRGRASFRCFLCFLRGLSFFRGSGLSGLGLCALVGAHFCGTGIFILERVCVGGSIDAPGLGRVRHGEEQEPAIVLERVFLEVWLDPAVSRIK